MSLKKQTQILQPVLLYLRGPSMFSILRVYHPHYPLCCSHTGCLPVLDVLVKSNSGPLCSLLPLPESVTASAIVPGMCFLILLPPGSPALMLGADIQDEAQLHPHPSTQRPPPAAPVQAAKSPRSPQLVSNLSLCHPKGFQRSVLSAAVVATQVNRITRHFTHYLMQIPFVASASPQLRSP